MWQLPTWPYQLFKKAFQNSQDLQINLTHLYFSSLQKKWAHSEPLSGWHTLQPVSGQSHWGGGEILYLYFAQGAGEHTEKVGERSVWHSQNTGVITALNCAKLLFMLISNHDQVKYSDMKNWHYYL